MWWVSSFCEKVEAFQRYLSKFSLFLFRPFGIPSFWSLEKNCANEFVLWDIGRTTLIHARGSRWWPENAARCTPKSMVWNVCYIIRHTMLDSVRYWHTQNGAALSIRQPCFAMGLAIRLSNWYRNIMIDFCEQRPPPAFEISLGSSFWWIRPMSLCLYVWIGLVQSFLPALPSSCRVPLVRARFLPNLEP